MANKAIEVTHTKEKAELSHMAGKNGTFKLILELVAAASIVFSIIWEVRVETHQYEWDKKVETLHVLENRDKSITKLIHKKTSKIQNADSLISAIKGDSLLNSNMRDQLNMYEDISIGQQIGVYDVDVIDKFIGTGFIRFHDKFLPWIRYKRDEDKNNRIYINYDLCVEELKKMRLEQ